MQHITLNWESHLLIPELLQWCGSEGTTVSDGPDIHDMSVKPFLLVNMWSVVVSGVRWPLEQLYKMSFKNCLQTTPKFDHCIVSHFEIFAVHQLSYKPLLLLLLLRGDSSAGEKRRTDSDSRAVKHLSKGGEECRHQSQNTGGHQWTQSPAGEAAAGEEVEERRGSNLVLWTTKVSFTWNDCSIHKQ